MVPLRTKLRNGDIVEISTQTGHAPSRDWLSFTKSSRARNKIKHWINEHQRERAIEIGQKLLDREARKYKIALSKYHDPDYISVASEYGLTTQAELLAGVGFGKYSARQVLNKLEPGSTIAIEPAAEQGVIGNTIDHMSDAVKRVFFGKGSDSLQVEGQDDLLVYRARCCNPIRGEEIIGYVTLRQRRRRTRPQLSHRPEPPTSRTAASRSSGRPFPQPQTTRPPEHPSPRPTPSSSPSSATTAPAC